LNNSQKLLILKEHIDLTKQRINEARALNFPKIDYNFSFAKFDNSFPMVLSPSFCSLYMPVDNKDQYYVTGFSLWQYLYAGGRYTTSLRVAETNRSQTESQYEIVKNETIKDIKLSYYNLLVIKEKINSYDNAAKEIIIYETKNAAKREYFAELKDKINGEVLLTKHEYDMAKIKLLDTIGIELDTDIDIQGEIVIPNEKYDLHKCLACGFEYRPELRQTQFQEAIDSLQVNLSLTERYPTVTLGANYEWLGYQFPLSEKNWSAVVNFNVPIFDGWASWARIKQRKLQLREGKIHRAELEDKIRLEVRQSYLDYNYWQEKLSGINIQKNADLAPEKKLELTLLWLDTVKNLIESHIRLEWALGKSLSELK
jgi:outer membrane protein TolC